MKQKYKFLEHTADVKFQAFGKSVKEVFENSASALKETIAPKIKVKSKIKKNLAVEGTDFESLLYNFLEEFLYLLDAEDFLLSEIKDLKISSVKKGGLKGNKENGHLKLKAVVLGDKASNYKFTNDVKAITYNDMFVKNTDGKWVAQVVLDV